MNEYYLKKAEENIPALFERYTVTDKTVKMSRDTNRFMNVGTRPDGSVPDCLNSGDEFILDFGRHCVGYISFTLGRVDKYPDAPVRLRLDFGEVPYELSRDFGSYKGTLCSSWLQSEIINADIPGDITLPRRYSFRYVRITVTAAPRKIKLSGFKVKTVTSADLSALTPLPDETEDELKKIDAVASATLADCMQTVYEDGPKRDRRLWSGDLRLQALTDYYLYKNSTLVRRCLYLFAACEEDGKFLPGCLYRVPEVFYDDGMGITDYAMLFTTALCDYYEHTSDVETTEDLFPVAQRQIELAVSLIDGNGLLHFLGGWERFIDWAEGLRSVAAAEGVFLYALEKMSLLAAALKKDGLSEKWSRVLADTRSKAFKLFYNADKKAFINEYDGFQYSVQTQVWMILGGVIDGTAGKNLLTECLKSSVSIKPVTPYMHHYVVEAMIRLGMEKEALEYIKRYWGGMVKKNADTFWEVYVPSNPKLSPYNDPIMNSFCHAWSCTPAYFIRKYFC